MEDLEAAKTLDAILLRVKKRFVHNKTIKHSQISQNSSCYQSHLNRTKLSHGSVCTEFPVETFGLSKIRPVPCERSLSFLCEPIRARYSP